MDLNDNEHRRVSPSVCARDLRRRLLRARLRARNPDGSSRFPDRRHAADALGWSNSKQQNLETGLQAVAVRDLDRIFQVLDVPDCEHELWRRLADGAAAAGWWDQFSDSEMKPPAKQWAGYEWGARRLRSNTASFIPGLLQTDAYTDSLLSSAVYPASPEEIRHFLAARAHRRTVLGEPDPLIFHAIFDEAAIRRMSAPEVMADQIAHIIDIVTTRPNVTVQIVPFDVGVYPGMASAYSLLDFGMPDDDGLLEIESGIAGATYTDDLPHIAACSRAFERLASQVAASPADTLDVLRAAYRALGHTDE